MAESQATKTEAGTSPATENNVLIAVDSSEQAEYAFNFYLENVHQKEQHIVILHVSEMPVIPASNMYISTELLEELSMVERAKAKEIENKFAKLLQQKHLSGKIKVTFSGRAGETIVEQAEKEKAKFVVMGTRGMGKLRRTVLGSVSDYVLHHVHCPIIICRQ